MKAISLFTGVGGFDLGFERAGIETVLQAERDPHCLKVLERHWPQVRRVTDVRCVGLGPGERDQQGQPIDSTADIPDVARTRDVDLVFGGFPCQPFSVAGKRAGLGDERSLWPEFRRILSELRPAYAVLENVPGLLSACGCEACWWAGVYLGRHKRRRGDGHTCPQCRVLGEFRGRHKGNAFKAILTDLVELGFGGVGWAVLDARHFGVPQRRRRVFIVAGPGVGSVRDVLSVCESCGGNPETGRTAGERVAYSLTAGVRGTGDHDTYIPDIVASVTAKGSGGPAGDEIQDLVYAPSVMRSGVRRLTPLECERLQGFPDGWTDLPQSDSHRYRQMGNAVCVPVAEWIGHRIVATEKARIATGLEAVTG